MFINWLVCITTLQNYSNCGQNILFRKICKMSSSFSQKICEPSEYYQLNTLGNIDNGSNKHSNKLMIQKIFGEIIFIFISKYFYFWHF
jgi:hypothetical protein